MRIAICDDEKTYIEKLKNDINSLQTHENEFEFSEFESGESFIEQFSKDKYDWFCQYHLTHFIRTRIMQRERYDHSRAFFELPEAAHRWRCRFFC